MILVTVCVRGRVCMHVSCPALCVWNECAQNVLVFACAIYPIRCLGAKFLKEKIKLIDLQIVTCAL